MTGYSALHNTAVVASYPFATRTHVIDLGGGNGGLLTAILQAHPALTGTLVELEPAIAQARPWWRRQALQTAARSRLETSFRQYLPPTPISSSGASTTGMMMLCSRS